MAIYSASGHKEVIDAILAENTFEYPLTVDNTRITKVVVDAKDPSKARVTVDGVYDSGMYGFTSVNVNRVDVAKMMTGVNPVIKANSDDARKVSDVLPAIADQLGIDLPPEWIVDAELVLNNAIGDRPLYGAKFTVAPNHPVLYGSFDFSVDGIVLDINRLITKVEVGGIPDPLSHQASKFSAYNLVYGNDYTVVADSLSEIKLCTVPTTLSVAECKKIAEAVSMADGLPWISRNGTLPFNIYNGALVCHCRTVDFDIAGIDVNTDYTHVLVMRVYPTYCSNISYSTYDGIMFHYDRLEGRE